MKNKISSLIALFFYLVLAGVSCRKHDAVNTTVTKTGTVMGSISNEYNQLLAGATTTIKGATSNSTVSTSEGKYVFSSLQTGTYNLSVKKDGYLETSVTVLIKDGDTTYKDFTLKAGAAYINILSDTVVSVAGAGGAFTINVASNTGWVINSTAEWIVAAKQGSNGSDSTRVNVAATPSDTARQGLLTVQAGGLIKNVLVIQRPAISFKQVIVLPGNLVKGIPDSIALLFNQPVTITSIFPGNTFCQSDIKYAYSENKVTFSYACADIGGDYPFTISMVNSYGDKFTQTFTAGFYDKEINLTGTIQNYFVNDADNSYWIITDHPNALYKIDINTFDIIHKYDLPYEPVMFTVNPYNNKIYLAYTQIPKLFILNQDGNTEQIIDIAHDTTRTEYENGAPRIYPQRLVFTKSGKGMIWLGGQYWYNYSGFWFIDAAAGHRIWYESLPDALTDYTDAKTNYDKTKIILQPMGDGDPTISTFDPAGKKFSNYKPGKTTRGEFITPSRQNANIYSGQLYNQLIVNPETGFESLESFKDNRSFGNMDFCYLPGKDQTIYFAEEGHIEVLDYTNQTSPVAYSAINILKGITTTLDGKYVIATHHDGNYHAKVLRLPGSWFRY